MRRETNEIQEAAAGPSRLCLLLSENITPHAKQGVDVRRGFVLRPPVCRAFTSPDFCFFFFFRVESPFSSPVGSDLHDAPPALFISPLIVFPHLSLCYLFPRLPLLSTERVREMDVMRQVHAGRETEAVPPSHAAVNKVKNNQVRVGRGSPRACRSPPHSCTTIHHFLLQK